MNAGKKINLKDWKDRLHGHAAFIIGNGPSAIDHDLTHITSFFTVGINRAFLLFDPVVLLWQDANLTQSSADRIPFDASTAIKVVRDIVPPKPDHYRYHVDTRRDTEYHLPTDPGTLFGIGSTGPLAFQFAFALGCDPIVLIGFDCTYRNGQTDFWGVNRHHYSGTLPRCVKGMKWIADVAPSCGRHVIHCGDSDLLPRQPLEEAIIAAGRPLGREWYKNTLMK